MHISPTNVYFDDEKMWVDLSDGRTIGAPLVCFPRLLEATQEQRQNYELSPGGIHWWDLDEDISVNGLLEGHDDDRQLMRKTINEMMLETQRIQTATVRLSSQWYYWVPPMTFGIALVTAVIAVCAVFSR